MGEGYAPGWGQDALSMMRLRRADTRAAFVLPFLDGGVRVLDVGCGPGTITQGLAGAVAPDGLVLGIDMRRSQVELATELAAGAAWPRFAQGSVYALPVAANTVDVVFAHGLFEHLGRLAEAIAESRRVLRPGGVLAVSSSDWSGAVIEPRTPDVDLALRGHYLLRRRAGGDPLAGGRLAATVRAAEFTDVTATETSWPDMSYPDLARYIAARLDDAGLADARDAALRWAERDGTFVQRWVQVTARR